MNEIEKLLAAITKLVNASQITWDKKQNAVLSECSHEDKIALYEFCSWFSE